jgi:uncharacterized protein (TIGR03437 family)
VRALLLLFVITGSLIFAQTPAVTSGGICNAASCAANQTVAPGSLISIFGSNLASSLSQADSIPLSTTLGGVGVTINSTPAPLLFVSAGQINAQLPWNAGNGTASIVVTRDGATSSAVSFPVGSLNPGIFTLSGDGTGQAIAYGNSDGAFAAPAGSVPPPYTAHPAKIGDPTSLVILATGMGSVDPPVTTGDIPPSGTLARTTVTPTVLVGGVAAQVVFSGLAPGFVGVNQINIVIASGTPVGDAVPLQIEMGGITTSDKVTIAVTQ